MLALDSKGTPKPSRYDGGDHGTDEDSRSCPMEESGPHEPVHQRKSSAPM